MGGIKHSPNENVVAGFEAAPKAEVELAVPNAEGAEDVAGELNVPNALVLAAELSAGLLPKLRLPKLENELGVGACMRSCGLPKIGSELDLLVGSRSSAASSEDAIFAAPDRGAFSSRGVVAITPSSPSASISAATCLTPEDDGVKLKLGLVVAAPDPHAGVVAAAAPNGELEELVEAANGELVPLDRFAKEKPELGCDGAALDPKVDVPKVDEPKPLWPKADWPSVGFEPGGAAKRLGAPNEGTDDENVVEPNVGAAAG